MVGKQQLLLLYLTDNSLFSPGELLGHFDENGPVFRLRVTVAKDADAMAGRLVHHAGQPLAWEHPVRVEIAVGAGPPQAARARGRALTGRVQHVE